eukprot:6180939-Pleurochrysis_carterae.AAC.2
MQHDACAYERKRVRNLSMCADAAIYGHLQSIQEGRGGCKCANGKQAQVQLASRTSSRVRLALTQKNTERESDWRIPLLVNFETKTEGSSGYNH